MGQILVRKLDDNVIARLRLLAKERNISVEALARHALEEAAERRTSDEMRSWLKELDELRAMSPPSNIDSVPLIRALRDNHAFDD